MTSHPAAVAHRSTLHRLIKIAQATLAADGMDEDLARHASEIEDLRQAIMVARASGTVPAGCTSREYWPLLVQACAIALRRLRMHAGTPAGSSTIAQAKTVIGCILPLVMADWQTWRDAAAPKIGGQGHG